MSDDVQLLQHYTREGSQAAFRELVEQHIQLVHATARRIVAGDTHLADDVTQLVFTDLARKAATLPDGVLLGGWLYRHTCYTALKAIRTENRRRTRERTAMEIHALNDSSARDAHWAQLAPVLDNALSQLPAEDRDAIVLRYLQQKDVRSIGAMLGTSENAAQKRLGRALDKLRAILTRRGITVSAALLTTALDAGAATAPVASGLAASVSATALSSAAVGATATSFTLTALTTMITSKLALGVAAAVVAAGITTVVLTQKNSPDASASTSIAKTSASLTTPVVNSPTKVVTTTKVEAPKAAPAPAGGAAMAVDTTLSDPFADPNGGIVTQSGSGTLTIAANDPFAPTVSSSTFSTNGQAISTRRVTGGSLVGGTSGATRSISMSNGQMTVTTTNPDGTVTTQNIPVATSSNGKDAVISFSTANGTQQMMMVPAETPGDENSQHVFTFTDANGVTHTQVMSAGANTINGASGTIKGNGTLIMTSGPAGGTTSGATVILSNGPDTTNTTSP